MTVEVTPEAEVRPATASFKLKGGLYPLTLLELNRFNKDALEQELKDKVSENPDFFRHTPVVLSTEYYEEELGEIKLKELRELCHNCGLILVALRGGDQILQEQAIACGMGLIPASRKKNDKQSATQAFKPASAQPAKVNKIVNTPIRSGQQVYAAGGDLIVTAPVSAGAEILADGNIHVYGPVRGRVLAGVKGDKTARVYCQSLEAELISIAGRFTTDEDSQSKHWKNAVQIYLTDEALCIEPL